MHLYRDVHRMEGDDAPALYVLITKVIILEKLLFVRIGMCCLFSCNLAGVLNGPNASFVRTSAHVPVWLAQVVLYDLHVYLPILYFCLQITWEKKTECILCLSIHL